MKSLRNEPEITVADAEGVAGQMALSRQHPEIQRMQTYFRMQLVAGWHIPPGASVLEIGCGQGDMTAALAHAVGSAGHVLAVDIAPPGYGGPLTVGQSADYLKSMPLGERIDFRLQCNLLDPSISFPADRFDYVVLAHCSWYFASLDEFRRILLRIHPWAKHLCYAEWEMAPNTLDQVAHLLAVLIQGEVAAFQEHSTGNVRTPFSRTRCKQLLRETGWHVTEESRVDSTQLMDAEWEIANCLGSSLSETALSAMPSNLLELLSSQKDTLRTLAGSGKNRSLSSILFAAERY